MAPKKNKRNSPDTDPKLPFLEVVETQARQYINQVKDGRESVKIVGPNGKKISAQIATKNNPLRMESEISKPMNGKKGSHGIILKVDKDSELVQAIEILDEEYKAREPEGSDAEFISALRKTEQPDGSLSYEVVFKFFPQWFKPREVGLDAHDKLYELKEAKNNHWIYESQFDVFGTASISYGWRLTTEKGEVKYGYCLGPKDFFFQRVLTDEGESIEPESKRARVSDML